MFKVAQTMDLKIEVFCGENVFTSLLTNLQKKLFFLFYALAYVTCFKLINVTC